MLGSREPGQEVGAKAGTWAPAQGAFSLRVRALSGSGVVGVWAQEAGAAPVTGRDNATAIAQVREGAGPD